MKDASKAGNVLQAIAALGLTAAMATALALPSAAAPGPNDIVVDPQGEVSTLAAAQQALRGLGGTGPVTVWIKGGTYTVPLEFTAADRPNVTWRGMPGEEVVLTGAKDITGWQADTVNGLACWSTRAEGGYLPRCTTPRSSSAARATRRRATSSWTMSRARSWPTRRAPSPGT